MNHHEKFCFSSQIQLKFSEAFQTHDEDQVLGYLSIEDKE